MTITKEVYIITAEENGKKQYLLDIHGYFAGEYYIENSSQYRPKEFKSEASALKWYKQHLKYNDGSLPYMPRWYPLNKINIEKITYKATI